MNQRMRVLLVSAAVLTSFAAPVLAESTTCTVTAPEIRLRKSPSKKSKVVTNLKKDTRVTAEKCGGGWVKILSQDGRVKGYVGGWALSETNDKVAAPAVTPDKPEVAKTEPVPAVKEIPTNEQLAVQITNLRLNVLSLNRDVENVQKEIKKIKVTLAHNGRGKNLAATSGKGHKQKTKKG